MLVNGFKDMSYLEGEEVELVRERIPPSSVRFVKDYGKTVLVEMTYTDSMWGTYTPPRTMRRMVPKGAMLCGDFVLKHGHIYLTGSDVGNYHGAVDDKAEF